MSTKDLFQSLITAEIRNQMDEHRNTVNAIDYPKIGKIKLDKYKFTDIDRKVVEHKPLKQLTSELKSAVNDEENVVVIHDGNIVYQKLSDAFKDIKITSLHEALKSGNQPVIDALTTDIKELANDKFQAINRAYRNSGLYIEVPQNVVVKDALKVHLIASNDLVHRTVFIANKNSQLSLLEKIDNIKPVTVNITTFTDVRDNAHVKYTGIDRLSNDSLAYIERKAVVGRDGNLIYALGQLNDGHAVTTNHVQLRGENAHCESRNLLLTDNDILHAVTINIEHFAEHSVGHIINHGIVKDKSHLHVDGIGKIHRGMRRSDAQQNTHIVVLSDEAQVDANPYLLIDEYDVTAGHGAGVGKIDPNQLYYLMSRGMTKIEAEKLILLGFVAPVIELIDSELIRTDLIKTIEDKLVG